MTKIELPSGGWVQLRDVETIRQGDMDDLIRDLPKVEEDRPFRFGVGAATGLKMLMIEDWHIPYLSDPKALPVAHGGKLLRELTIADNRRLEEALKPAQELLFAKAPSVDDEQLEDPGSPTTPANE